VTLDRVDDLGGDFLRFPSVALAEQHAEPGSLWAYMLAGHGSHGVSGGAEGSHLQLDEHQFAAVRPVGYPSVDDEVSKRTDPSPPRSASTTPPRPGRPHTQAPPGTSNRLCPAPADSRSGDLQLLIAEIGDQLQRPAHRRHEPVQYILG
jgi:hypothetical protein